MSVEIENIIEEYNKLEEKLAEMRKEASQNLKTALHDLFKKTFASVPELAYITWTQYTQYYNDGDPCNFRLGDQFFVLHKHLEESDEWEEGDYYPTGYAAEEIGGVYLTSWSQEREISELSEKFGKDRGEVIYFELKKVRDILDSVPNEVYLGAFEDHVSVLVTKDGIEVNEYSEHN